MHQRGLPCVRWLRRARTLYGPGYGLRLALIGPVLCHICLSRGRLPVRGAVPVAPLGSFPIFDQD